MKVGDLVIYHMDNDIGIITKHRYDRWYVQWSDGTNGWHVVSEMEVINESR